MKKKLFLMTGVALIAITGNAIISASNRDSVGADEVPPIVQQVNDHENRIADTEAKNVEQDNQIAETKDQVSNVKERTVVVERKVETQVNTPAPAPKALAEGEITSVKIEPGEVFHPETDKLVPGFHCIYTINTVTRYKSSRVPVLDPNLCKKVGDLYL